MTAVHKSRPTKRRTGSQMDGLRQAIYEVLEEIQPATVRQVFYQLVSRGVIEKTESQYKSTVVRLLTAMRRAGEIPFGWIADHTRWMRKPTSYASLSDMLAKSQHFYRRALWESQPVYVEIWLEKDALAGVLYEVTAELDVPLMVTRGYPSLSYLYEAAAAMAATGKPACLYYFGDYDPSGCDIPRAVEQGIREFAPQAEIHFERVAVTREQIERWALPTRPTKKTDSRSKAFQGGSVELDAVGPADLRRLVRNSIIQHINAPRWALCLATEEQERATLRRLVEALEGEDLQDQRVQHLLGRGGVPSQGVAILPGEPEGSR